MRRASGVFSAVILAFSIFLSAARAELELRGFLSIGARKSAVLYENTAGISKWVSLGQTFQGYTLAEIDIEGDRCVLSKGETKVVLQLVTPVISAPENTAEKFASFYAAAINARDVSRIFAAHCYDGVPTEIVQQERAWFQTGDLGHVTRVDVEGVAKIYDRPTFENLLSTSNFNVPVTEVMTFRYDSGRSQSFFIGVKDGRWWIAAPRLN